MRILLLMTLCISTSFLQAQTGNPVFDKIQPAVKGGGFAMKDYWVWCGSVIKAEDGKYHMFASRWPKKLPFHPGWMIASEIVQAVADKPEGPYQFLQVVLPARGAQYWDGRSTHNPSITKVNDTFVLFYMGSTHPFDEPQTGTEVTVNSPYATVGRANKRIGIATAKNINGPWVRRNAPILDVKPNTFYSFLTSNPAPLIRKDGSVLIVFKGRAYGSKYPYHSEQKLGIAMAKSINDSFHVLNNDEPLFTGENYREVEDPFLWEDEKGLHLMVKDMTGKLGGEQSAGVLYHSKDGINWKLDPHPRAYSRTITWSDGSQQIMGQLERPFILFEGGKPRCLFFATMDGKGGFENGTRSWNMAVPLR